MIFETIVETLRYLSEKLKIDRCCVDFNLFLKNKDIVLKEFKNGERMCSNEQNKWYNSKLLSRLFFKLSSNKWK